MARGSLQMAARMDHVELVAVVGVGPQHGAQVIGQHDVEQGVEGRGAALGRDVGHGAEGAALVGRGVGVADDVGAPAGQPPEHAGLLAVGQLVELDAHGGVGQLAPCARPAAGP